MSLPRSCHVCGGVHAAGTRCPVAAAKHEKRRGSSHERYGSGWASISKAVIERDGGVCQLQLPGCTHRATTADHIQPRSKGGTAAMSNLQAACRHCNSSKGAAACH